MVKKIPQEKLNFRGILCSDRIRKSLKPGSYHILKLDPTSFENWIRAKHPDRQPWFLGFEEQPPVERSQTQKEGGGGGYRGGEGSGFTTLRPILRRYRYLGVMNSYFDLRIRLFWFYLAFEIRSDPGPVFKIFSNPVLKI